MHSSWDVRNFHKVQQEQSTQRRSICRLLSDPDRVDIRCVECILDGSPGVKQLRLNERVEFNVHTTFIRQQGEPLLPLPISLPSMLELTCLT